MSDDIDIPPAPHPSSNPTAYPSEPEAETHDPIAQLTAERDDMRDRWIRAEAEIANVRSRAKRDIDDTRQYAVQKFATDVVEAAENLRRGLTSLPPHEPGGLSWVARRERRTQ